MLYIIIYNAETDFVMVYNEGQLKEQLKQLLEEGYGLEGISVYKAEEQSFGVELTGINISLGDKSELNRHNQSTGS